MAAMKMPVKQPDSYYHCAKGAKKIASTAQVNTGADSSKLTKCPTEPLKK